MGHAQTASSEIVLALRERKAEIRDRYRADIKGIFGSHARGEALAQSDIDILVEFDPDANLLHLSGLAIYLEERLGRPVDIVPESALRPEIRASVLKDAIYI